MKASEVYHKCEECGKQMQRCRNAWTNDGEDHWVCRKCWKALDYDAFLYEHLKDDGYGHGV